MIRILYSEYFKEFLDKFPTEKQELIKEIIKKYSKHAVLLPRPKSSGIHKDIEKVAIPEAKVIIFYVNAGDTWVIFTGVKMFDRAA